VVSSEFLARAELETGFRGGVLEKVVRLGQLADDITKHPVLGGALALKGGTALNLCWGMPTRLSVDLDYNFVAHLEREAMLEARPRIERAVIALVGRRGYRVQQSPEAFAGRKLFLSYTSAFGQPDRIEVDLNFIHRMPIAGLENRALWQPGGLDPSQVRVVSLTELCIGKLMALLARTAARDAWDVWRLPVVAAEILGSPSFRCQFLVMAATLDHELPTYTQSRLAARIDDRGVREHLVPMLVSGDAPAASDLIDGCWSVVAPLLSLDRREEEFVTRVSRGEFLAELLSDPAAVELERHPAVQWKLANARLREEGR
jgi:hypothetical protein